MTGKKLTSLEAIELLKKLKKNNIDDQEVEDMLLDIIEEELKEHRLLKNIEEEVGIDLIKAVELCKQVNNKKVVYIKDEFGIYPIKILDYLDIELGNHRLYSNSRGIYVSLDLKEYGKNWALDKNDLVHNIVKRSNVC